MFFYAFTWKSYNQEKISTMNFYRDSQANSRKSLKSSRFKGRHQILFLVSCEI